MTSSLVGSEMCIRDSVLVVALGWGLLTGHLACCMSASDLTTELVVLEPVSYTHLTLPTICSV
eukprot:2572255-Prorocentrum_lima.AAC.1